MFNGLIKQLLSLDPTQRPGASQVLEQLSAIAETNGFRSRGPLDLPAAAATPAATATVSSAVPSLGLPSLARSQPTTPEESAAKVGIYKIVIDYMSYDFTKYIK